MQTKNRREAFAFAPAQGPKTLWETRFGQKTQAMTKAAICNSGEAAVATSTAAARTKAVMTIEEGRVVVIGVLQGSEGSMSLL
jgi:hypothetical protein